MKIFASGCWRSMESIHRQMLKDQKPENERANMDPDHWYELNLTNSFLFSNLTAADDAKQLVPGRLFTTRMPRNIYDKSMKEGKDFEE